MADEHNVTLGEVYRLTLSISQRLEHHANNMISRKEYEAGQARTSDRFHDHDEDISDLKAEIASTRADLNASKAHQMELERKQNDRRSTRTLTAVSWVAVPLVTAVIAVLFLSGGQ